MTLTIRPIHPLFCGEVSGVDLARELSPQQVQALEAGMDRYAVLLFRDQPLLLSDLPLPGLLDLGHLGILAGKYRPQAFIIHPDRCRTGHDRHRQAGGQAETP